MKSGKREEGRGKREEGRGKSEEGSGKREEGRVKREEWGKRHRSVNQVFGNNGLFWKKLFNFALCETRNF